MSWDREIDLCNQVNSSISMHLPSSCTGAVNALSMNGITKLGHLKKYSIDQLKAIPYVGTQTMLYLRLLDQDYQDTFDYSLFKLEA